MKEEWGKRKQETRKQGQEAWKRECRSRKSDKRQGDIEEWPGKTGKPRQGKREREEREEAIEEGKRGRRGTGSTEAR